MDIRSAVAEKLRQHIREHGKSLAEFSADFDIPLTSLKDYVKGDVNLRADTIEMLSAKLGMTPADFISESPAAWRRAEAVFSATYEFAHWPQERQERAISLFLELAALFAEDDAHDRRKR